MTKAMKVEKDNACDRVDVCEEQCKAAKLRASKAEDEVDELMTKARQLETELDLTTEKLGIATLQQGGGRGGRADDQGQAAGDRVGPDHREAWHCHSPAGGEGEAAGCKRVGDERPEQNGVRSGGGPREDRGEDGGRCGQAGQGCHSL